MIVRATLQDLDAACCIARESFPSEVWTRESLQEELAREGGIFLVARAESGVARGFLLAWQVLDELHLLQIAVMPHARRGGVASALLARLLSGAFSAPASVVFLEVRASNAAALSFYSGRGFREIGRRRAYYSHPTEDAVVMALELEGEGRQLDRFFPCETPR